MSPIYNPASASTSTQADEEYFTEIGILTASMSKLVDGSIDYQAFDSTGGAAISITDSVAKSDSSTAYSFAAYDVSGKTKILFLSYMHLGAQTIPGGLGIHDSTTYGPLGTGGASNKDLYQMGIFDNEISLYKTTGATPTWTALSADTTIGYESIAHTTAANGLAIYADGTDVKTWVKLGSTGQWIPINSVSDSSHVNYDEVYLRYNGLNARFITPVYCWGS